MFQDNNSHGSRQSEPEVVVRAQREHHNAEYKQRILEEINAAHEPAEIRAILRREDLYAQDICRWRQQMVQGRLERSSKSKRGSTHDSQESGLGRLESENDRLRKQLERAELIIDFQKKISQMLGMNWDVPEIVEKS